MGSSTVTETHTAGRIIGVVTRDSTREKGFVFLKDAENNEYFAHISAFEDSRDFLTLQRGEGVSFRATSTSKGYRAWEIRRATLAEAVRVDEMEDYRGNR
jgi:cold shock CspA family protein